MGYQRLAADLGIDPAAMMVMDRALDTDQEARDVAALEGKLAVHSRDLRLPHAPGDAPDASRREPTRSPHPPDSWSRRPRRAAERFGLIPGSRGLRETETALHEYLGLAVIGLGMD